MRRRGGVTHVMQERPDSQPQANVLYRGLYDQPREMVKAGTPPPCLPWRPPGPAIEWGLARWLVDESTRLPPA